MEEKHVVITGASGGIGAALAILLAEKGHKLALGARREKELKKVAAKIGANAIALVTDVTRRRDMERLRDKAIEKFGYIDVWLNNAGRGIDITVMDLTDKDFNEMINVNLRSVFYGIQTIIPHFMQRGKGHLINISSLLGRVPFLPARSLYSASKAAVNALTDQLRNDLRASYPDIQISLVLPGRVRSDFIEHMLGVKPGVNYYPKESGDMAHSPEEAAQYIVSLIEHPVPEIYIKPELAELAILYYQDKDAFAKKMKH